MLTEKPEFDDLRSGVRQVCAAFDGAYWRGLEPDSYPEEFVAALTEAGYLGALVPEEFGGGGATLTEASIILEEISASGGKARAEVTGLPRRSFTRAKPRCRGPLGSSPCIRASRTSRRRMRALRICWTAGSRRR